MDAAADVDRELRVASIRSESEWAPSIVDHLASERQSVTNINGPIVQSSKGHIIPTLIPLSS